MVFVADFHIHSKYSRATSPNMDLENLDKWAKIKGIKILGTGDFTHPEWFRELKSKLVMAEQGLFKLQKSNSATRFLLTSEISCIYSKGEKVRKIHILIFAPSFEICEKINSYLATIGNLKADGRPILGLDAKELLKNVLEISSDCLIVPAHIWTPWFSLFGSKSGFNSIEECFEEYSKYIYAVETGLSSDPSMNWKIADLDKVALISNSDCHSPQNIGREANVFDLEVVNYFSIIEAIKSNDSKKFLYTIEFFPELGKYHYDGHRKCGVCLSPDETEKIDNKCPICDKALTIGVLNRVEELADKNRKIDKTIRRPFKSLIPLREIIAECLGIKAVNGKQVNREYGYLIEEFKTEFNVLLDAPYKSIATITLPKIAQAILRIRKGRVSINPGYDGTYGKIAIK